MFELGDCFFFMNDFFGSIGGGFYGLYWKFLIGKSNDVSCFFKFWIMGLLLFGRVMVVVDLVGIRVCEFWSYLDMFEILESVFVVLVCEDCCVVVLLCCGFCDVYGRFEILGVFFLLGLFFFIWCFCFRG